MSDFHEFNEFDDDDLDIFFMHEEDQEDALSDEEFAHYVSVAANKPSSIPNYSLTESDYKDLEDKESAKVSYFAQASEEELLDLVKKNPEDISFIDNPSVPIQMVAMDAGPEYLFHIDNPCSDAIVDYFMTSFGSAKEKTAELSDIGIDYSSLNENQMITLLSQDITVLPFLPSITIKVKKYIEKTCALMQELADLKFKANQATEREVARREQLKNYKLN